MIRPEVVGLLLGGSKPQVGDLSDEVVSLRQTTPEPRNDDEVPTTRKKSEIIRLQQCGEK